MNLLNIIDRICYFLSVYKLNQKNRYKKSNFVFDNKTIGELKVSLRIMSEKKFDLKTTKKNFKSKNRAYVIVEKKNYYDFNKINEQNDN